LKECRYFKDSDGYLQAAAMEADHYANTYVRGWSSQ